jgi:serine/threonine protein kinase/formylglycine-generating enzyme required for sulfatase activity
MPEPIEFEHYQLLQREDGSLVELGRGAMGITYKAFDRNLRCDVALKVITGRLLEDATAASRFLREARNAAKLRHRNVASVFHLGQHGGSYFYAMEFIDGETVSARVKRDGPLDCLFALEIAQQVASALIAAEVQNLVHRDIKPANLMLVREGDGEILVKVIDFGLAKTVVMQSTADLTEGGFVGTPYFASPEQLDRQTEDIRSDIYSLGITLWFMLTGKPTFMGSVASVIAQHMDRTPPYDDLAILPAEVVSVLKRMLEKDRERRIQAPAALRSELRLCIERLKRHTPEPNLSEFGDANFETIALTASPKTASLPQVGTLIKGRYRLIEDLDPDNPGHSYHSEDVSTKTRVALRLFRVSDELFTQIDEKARRVRAFLHPNILEVRDLGREEAFGFAVFEWLDGFSLFDLVRARRALTLREICLLLKQMAPVIDAAQDRGLDLEMNLHDIMIHFPDGFGQAESDLALRCPLDEWPPFVVKLDALGKAHEPGDTATGDRQKTGQRSGAEQEVIQLGLLVYELAGGKPGGFTPLTTASEDDNRVLRRCLTPGQSFSTATEFYQALGAISDARPAISAVNTGSAGNAVNAGSTGNVVSPGKDQARRIAETEETRGSSLASSVAVGLPGAAGSGGREKKGLGLWIALLLIGIGAAGFGWWWLVNRTYNPATAQPLVARPSPTVKKAVSNLPPLEAGEPWSNSLQMKFVPIGDIHFAVWQTRVRDFAAFVHATGYDAVGGMFSVVTHNGFKSNTLSWKDPGFAQTPDHPVVGVSWEDADQFCDWLTGKERSEGVLSAFQRYRLPTDEEWSRAIGLPHETGATPAERSGGVKNVYPWGNRFPPPNGFGNYAGSESMTGAPAGWSIIAGYHDAFPRTGPVTAFHPNRDGICSLGGNVWEWCEDKYQNNLNWRTLRGASWATSRNEETLSSYRRGYDPYFRSDDVGFRCVIASDGSQQ